MTATIHLEVEVLHDTTFTTACGAANRETNVTKSDAQVTCRKCRSAMGYKEELNDD